MTTVAQSEDQQAAHQRTIFTVRLVIASIQGVSLYLLAEAARGTKVWPATEPHVYFPLLLVVAWVPLTVLFAVGQVRFRTLAIWAAAVTLIVAALGFYDAMRAPLNTNIGEQPTLPWIGLWLALWAGLFVAHVLFVCSVRQRRLVPSYEQHFDTAWKVGVQGLLASAFVLVFGCVLLLGASLFKLVELDFLMRLIQKPYFFFPTAALALAISIHVTDVNVSLIRGARTLSLTLLSWLLPLLVLLLAGFLLSLLFVSLDALWKTRFAATLLLSASALLVFLINASYEDRGDSTLPSRMKQYAVALGSIELLPLVGLAAYALSLRVIQYGWTSDRVFAAAFVVIAFCYAAGYLWALIGFSAWQKRFETTNVVTAYVVLILSLSLFSPVADPARLMVADQVERLKSGVASVDTFDFRSLRFDGARWGRVALEELSRIEDHPDAAQIQAKARDALTVTQRWAPQPLATDRYPERVNVHPAGRTLPPNFFDAATGAFSKGEPLPSCIRSDIIKCNASLISLRDGEPEAVVFFHGAAGSVFQQVDGQWRRIGTLNGRMHCKDVKESIEHGEIKLDAHPWPDLVVGNERLTIVPFSQGGCEPVPAEPTRLEQVR